MNRLLCVFAASLAILVVVACSESYSPTAPTWPPTPAPPPAATGYIYGEVSGADGCLAGAVIEVLDGVAAGSRAVQTAEQCAKRDNSDVNLRYILHGLPRGTPVRLRASMAGYQSQEKSAQPESAQYIEPETPSVDFKLVRSF